MIATVPNRQRGVVAPQLALGGIEPRTSLLLVQVFASEPLLSDILLAVRRSLVLNSCYFGPISGLSGLFKPAPSSLQIAGSLSVFATGNLICGYPVYLTFGLLSGLLLSSTL